MRIAFSKSINTRLIIWFLLLSLGPLLGLSFYNYSSMQANMSNNAQSNMTNTAQLTAGALGDWLNEKVDVLKKIADNPAFQSGDTTEIMNYLESQAAATPYAETLIWADSTGRGVDSLGASPDISDGNYFRTALQGQTTISSVSVSKTTNSKVVYIAMPIKSSRGTSVLAMSLKSDLLSTLIDNAKYGSSGYAYLMDSTGMVIAHPDRAQVLKLNLLTSDSESLNQIGKTMIQTKQGTGEYLNGGTQEEVVYTPIPQTDWILALETPRNEVYMFTSGLIKSSLAIGLGVGIIVVLLALVISRQISKPIVALAGQTDRLATGDLSVEFQDKLIGELGILGNSLKTMTENLRHIIRQVNESTEQIAASSQELSASTEESNSSLEQVSNSIEEMADGAGKQAYSSQEVVELVTQIAQATDDVNNRITKMTQETESTQASVNDGFNAVINQKERMQENLEVTQRVAAAIDNLVKQSEEIGTILNTISNIAGQTNLLALNAAIEAARAGEYGRGFAVVADEVRKLAEESQHATGEIEKIVLGIQVGAQEASDEMTKTKRVVELQQEAVTRTDSSFKQISKTIQKMAERIYEVKASSEDIDKKVKSISKTIESIAAVAEQNAAGAEEISASTKELNAAAQQIAASATTLASLGQQLGEAVSIFKLS
ncbi:methyl-accepting chemotaxis protein [Desulfitobacterium sp. AusDCA]|uniref:methyl-accepting chemotaxis protein n=1 Tax=Desulfitobacterium sp. AusDCA TaxID=3240383 RepID=UPI003DA740DD